MKIKLLVSSGLALAMLSAPVLAADHTVTIRGMNYDPPMIEVAVGDTIEFINEDAAPHTATARDGSFDTGRLARGESAEIKIESAGTFEYFCTLHPAMVGEVVAQ